VDFIVKPESLRLVPPGKPGAVRGTVVERRFTGALTYCLVRLISGQELEVLDDAGTAEEGADILVAPRGEGPRPCVFQALELKG
jgi:hypothetical protein